MKTIDGVVDFLNQHNLSVTTAESCTAGLAASLLASISGCGSALHSGFIVYAADAKRELLGLDEQTMQTFGLTSEKVAEQMAIGAYQKTHSDMVVAITGTAESDDCLNGVVCFAYLLKTTKGYRLLSETTSFEGDRNEVRNAAAHHAIGSLPQIYEQLQSFPDIIETPAPEIL